MEKGRRDGGGREKGRARTGKGRGNGGKEGGGMEGRREEGGSGRKRKEALHRVPGDSPWDSPSPTVDMLWV